MTCFEHEGSFDSNSIHQVISRLTSGLGHHPFKVTRRVRFPYAIPNLCHGSSLGGQRIVYPTEAGSIPVRGARANSIAIYSTFDSFNG